MHRLRPPVVPVLVLAVAACATSGPDGPPSGPEAASDGFDRPEPASPGVPRDTSVDPGDRPLEPPVWRGRFIDLSAPLFTPSVLGAFVGDEVAGRGPSFVNLFVADLDGDGIFEVVHAEGLTEGPPPGQRAVRVHRWRNGIGIEAAVDLAAAIPRSAEGPYGAVDLDGDGHLDLLSGTQAVGIAWGRPGGWEPWAPLDDEPGFAGGLMAPALDDLDADGWLDLWVWSGSCSEPFVPAIRTAPRQFTLRGDLVGASVRPMRAAAILPMHTRPGPADLFVVADTSCGGGAPEVFVRATPGADGYPRYESWNPLPPRVWWKLDPAFAGLPMSAITPMGAGRADLDGDGLQDLVVTLGVSRQGLFAGRADGTFDEGDFDPGFEVDEGSRGIPYFPWSVGFPDLDHDGRADVLWTVGDDATSFYLANGEPMRNGALWNGGDGRFLDVAPTLGLDVLGSWHALALFDPDADGDADVVAGAFGSPSRAWRNDAFVPLQGGFSLRLRGTTSNALAIGARVEVLATGLAPQVRVQGDLANPHGYTEPWLFFGIGPNRDAVVRVRWPAGWTQEIPAVALGSHVLVEPPTVVVSDPDRHVPADGNATIEVVVTPRARDGRIATRPEVTLVALDAAVAVDPPVRTGGTWRFVVRAPTSPTSTRVEARIDGVALEVRPRLWFD